MVVPETGDATEGRPGSLLGPDDIAFDLELTAAQMKIVHTSVTVIR